MRFVFSLGSQVTKCKLYYSSKRCWKSTQKISKVNKKYWKLQFHMVYFWHRENKTQKSNQIRRFFKKQKCNITTKTKTQRNRRRKKKLRKILTGFPSASPDRRARSYSASWAPRTWRTHPGCGSACRCASPGRARSRPDSTFRWFWRKNVWEKRYTHQKGKGGNEMKSWEKREEEEEKKWRTKNGEYQG